MNKKRTSIVWKMDKEKLEKVVKESDSFSSVLRKFDLMNKGGNVKTLKRRLNEDNIDYSHIPQGVKSNKGRKFKVKKISLEKILVENSNYNRTDLKRRLIEEKILENKCSICSQIPLWKSKELVMVLDHINGICNDNRLENLRLLCPNCNSQTETFAGRNSKKEKVKYFCEICGEERYKGNKSKLCFLCWAKYKHRKIKDRPSNEVLLKQIKKLGYCGTARLYGVSDNAIRKWLKSSVS